MQPAFEIVVDHPEFFFQGHIFVNFTYNFQKKKKKTVKKYDLVKVFNNFLVNTFVAERIG